MTQKKENIEKLKEDWPLHYYEIDDAMLRKKLLEEMPQTDETKELSRIWNIRFKEGKNGEAADRFMEAWLMLKIGSQSSISFLNRRSRQKEMEKYAEVLQLQDPSDSMMREWRDFARTLLILCADTKAYRTAIFGLIDLGDKVTALRIAEEIDTVTGSYPEELGYKEQFEKFREVLIQAYKDILNNGEELWEEHENSR